MNLLPAMYDFLISPFIEFEFMRRALVATFALALSSAPLGIMLTLRRMSLFGEALSHAVLPGVAIGFIFFGLSLPALSIGGMLAGILIVLISGFVSRYTQLKEDASMAAIYLLAMAIGVILISHYGTQIDLLHILFGNVLAVDTDGLLLVVTVSTVSVLLFAGAYRGIVLENFDPAFMEASGSKVSVYQQLFLMMVVMNLVASFQTLGTLMAVGLMMLPAISARLWHDSLPAQCANAVLQSALAGYAGLLVSYYVALPSGPAIIVCAGCFYLFSLLVAPHGWLRRMLKRPHLQY